MPTWDKAAWLWLVAAMILVVSCAQVSPPPATKTPVATATPITPKSGAKLTGPVDIKEKVSSATLTLQVASDGTSLTRVGLELKDLKCDGMSGGRMTTEVAGVYPVKDGAIDAKVKGIGELKGRFTSPVQASGTISITLEGSYIRKCPLGEWQWNVSGE